jgi:hypothetical protein
MRLHVFPPSPRAMKVTALLYHLGLDCKIRIICSRASNTNRDMPR